MHGKLIWVGAGISALVLGTLFATGPANGAVKHSASRYVVNKLVADRPHQGAALVDPELVNPWGLSAGPGSPLWVSDNGTDVSTVYTGGMNGGSTTKVLSVGTPGGAPTGQVFNGTSGFKVAGAAATFIFAGEHGDITAWNGGANATKTAHTKNAVYKGLALVAGSAPRPACGQLPRQPDRCVQRQVQAAQHAGPVPSTPSCPSTLRRSTWP